MADSIDPKVSDKLPDNAYRELAPGEEYIPMVPASVTVPEITARSIIFGIIMNVCFAAAATYLALKVGQGIETAIPISILAVGLSGFLVKAGMRRSNIIENINVLAIGTTSGIVAGGTCFTMPAIYLLGLDEKLQMSTTSLFLQIFLVPFLGAILGVVLLVPFRRYFVKEMHGKLPFPEATATNEILVTGAGSGGSNAWILIYSFILSSVYTILAAALKLWHETFTTGSIGFEVKQRVAETGELLVREHHMLAFAGKFGQTLTDKLKLIFQIGTGAEFLGLGFIIGVRYASIICAGSFLSWFVIIPLLAPLSLESLQALNPAVSSVDAGNIFNNIPKNMGIGCIFTAGILSILKMGKVIVAALREAMGSLFRKKQDAHISHDRTDQDISYPSLFIVGGLVTVAIAIYFRAVVFSSMDNATWLTFVSVLLALAVSFVFITVSAWAIATISVTPISGMTVTTIIITAMVMLAAGLPKGEQAMLAVLLVGGVVAAALSMAGTLVTEFKLGYWAGASPRRIQWSAISAAAMASVVVTATIMICAKTPGYDPSVSASALEAPQANLMKSALQSFLGTGEVPWLMYGTGVAIALLLELVGISPLAFGLGMYLPMWLNTPILLGAIVAKFVKSSTKDEQAAKARSNKGILIASGLIAGAAITGVVLNGLESWQWAKIKLAAIDVTSGLINSGRSPEDIGRMGNWFGLLAFVALCIFVYWDCRRAKVEEGAPEIHM